MKQSLPPIVDLDSKLQQIEGDVQASMVAHVMAGRELEGVRRSKVDGRLNELARQLGLVQSWRAALEGDEAATVTPAASPSTSPHAGDGSALAAVSSPPVSARETREATSPRTLAASITESAADVLRLMGAEDAPEEWRTREVRNALSLSQSAVNERLRNVRSLGLLQPRERGHWRLTATGRAVLAQLSEGALTA